MSEGQDDLDEELVTAFLTEAEEHLESIEEHLLEVEETDDPEESLNAIFRAYHTIKGAAGFLGFDRAQALAHEAENLLDRMRTHQAPVSADNIDLVLIARDALKDILAKSQSGDIQGNEHESVFDALRATESDSSSDSENKTEQTDSIATTESANVPKEDQQPVTPTADTAGVQNKQQTDQNAAERASTKNESVRVDSARLDTLMNLIGELVIAEAIVASANEMVQGSDRTQIAMAATKLGRP